MKTETQKQSVDIITSLVINGDISKLSPQQRVHYYRQFCEKLGLDPLSQPFRILRLHGKEILYCDRGGAQQLNKLHRVSHEIKARETVNACYVVTAQASTPDGRKTESIGAVPIGNMKGEDLCNAMMKAETKAKRRATLDLLGLGILDETEVESFAKLPPSEGGDRQIKKTSIAVGGCLAEQSAEDDERNIPTSLFLNLKGLKKEVDKCTTEAELIALYIDNQKRIDEAPELKQIFTERKNELRKAKREAA
jgi:hypothetical protein